MSDLIERLKSYRPFDGEWGDKVHHTICDEAADALEARDKTISELCEALGTAMDFIESHVADPDLTQEMWGHYRKLDHMEPRRLISQAQSKDKAE